MNDLSPNGLRLTRVELVERMGLTGAYDLDEATDRKTHV